MSTILDSLKKSSDKRDDNNKNSMDNFSFSGNGKKRNSKSPVILILLITAAILYFGYRYLYTYEESEKAPITKSPIEEVADVKPVLKDDENVGLQAETKKRNKPNSSDVKQRIKEIKERRSEQQKALQALQKPPMKQEESQPSVKKPIASIKKDSLQSTSRDSSRGESSNQQPVTGLTELVEVKQVVEEQKYLYAYQLPFSLRKDLPTLKLNIHVFDKDPDNRIAVINGVRFAIDDMIDDVVLVKNIVPEGVLLEFNNRVFLVPK